MSKIKIISAPAPVSMAFDWYEIACMNHFWMSWRLNALLKYRNLLPDQGAEILDIGCGHGVFLHQIKKILSYKTFGCDLDLNALELAKDCEAELYVYDILEPIDSMLARFEAVFLLDVIEHINDDVGFLRSAALHMKSHGVLVINVPYGPWMFGQYDSVAGHKRRYTKPVLIDCIDKAGLKPLKVFFWGLPLIPLVLLRKQLHRNRSAREVITSGFEPPNKIFNYGMSILGRLESFSPVNPSVGTSLMAICQHK